MLPMKILFVERTVEYIDPMNIQLLSAHAKALGHKTELSIMSQDDVLKDVKRIKPDLVAFSAKTGEHTHYIRVNSAIKQYAPRVFSVIGGPHPTFFPGIIYQDDFDAVGIGECDDGWRALLDALESGESIDEIPNIVTKANAGRVLRHKTPPRGALLRVGNGHEIAHGFVSADTLEIDPRFLLPRKTMLDDLPFYDRDIVYRKTHLAHFPLRSFMSSRGCPFECTYCFEPKFNQIYRGKGPIFNRYSPKRLCAELKELKERWPTQFIKFYDDMFFVKKQPDAWLEEFSEIYPKKVGLPFFCLTRCNVLTPEVLCLLKRAGLHSMTMSIEAGNEYVRNRIIKRHMTHQEIVDAFDLCRREGIVTFANTILGIPVRPEIMAEQHKRPIDYDIEGIDLNIRCRVTYAAFQPLYPYPGCELDDYVRENSFFEGDFGELATSYNAESPFPCFTPMEKRMQNNLTYLGPICVTFHTWRWLRNLTVNRLIKLPLTKLYFFPWYLLHGYLNVFRVYPVRISFRQLLWNIWYSLKNEWRKRAPGKTLYQKPAKSNSAPLRMLGGPPRN